MRSHCEIPEPLGAGGSLPRAVGFSLGAVFLVLCIAIAGDQLVVRAATRRLSTWDLEGEHVEDIQLAKSLRQFVGIDAGFYLTISEEYQVHAYGPRRWSLRVAWARHELTDEHIDNVMAGFTDGPFTELRESDLEGPDRFQAIANLEVDGHGHIYVFPFYAPLNAPLPPDTERPDTDETEVVRYRLVESLR